MLKEESESDRERVPNRNTFAYKEKHRDEQKRERKKADEGGAEGQT